tara:strand:+ start:24215 stop:25165 length:951 start_codon:yes stop_codon:yes gene_type:complete
MYRSIRLTALCGVFLLSVLAGCGADKGAPRAPSQVVAKVNNEDLSVHQLNEVLARAGNVPADKVRQFSAAALERLIDQELMVQQAKDRKLDRDPKVVLAMEVARREILARAYAEQVIGLGARPSDSEVSAFYDANPGLFANRRIYDLKELNIGVPADRYDEVREQVERVTDLQQMAAWLNDQKITYVASAAIKPAEQLPLEILGGLSQLSAGQLAISRTPNGAIVLLLSSFRDDPIGQDKARPFIEQYLLNKSKVELARAEVKRLRDLASVEYIGDFKPEASETSAAASAQSLADETSGTDQSVRNALEKGSVRFN